MAKLEQKVDNEPTNESTIDLFDKTKKDYEELMSEKAKSAMFRCKAQWYEESDKGTKYFLNLERARAGAKCVTKLLKDDGTCVENLKDINREMQIFYQELYTKDETVEFTMENNTNIKIPTEQKQNLDEKISLEELTHALKNLARGKVPGASGLPSEFYIVFLKKN